MVRQEFTRLLHIYISSVLIPDEQHLQNSSFDRSNYLKRLNRFNFLSSDCGSIGSILKSEYNNFRLICSSSKSAESTIFLSLKFGERLCHLLNATENWFESQIVEYQMDLSTKFCCVTETNDVANPMFNVKLARQISRHDDQTELEILRDKEQTKYLREMLMGLRTRKTAYVDEEAVRLIQFGAELRQQLERAIGYKFQSGVYSDILADDLVIKGYVKVDCLAEFDIYVHSVALDDFRGQKSTFLQEAFGVLENLKMDSGETQSQELKIEEIIDSFQAEEIIDEGTVFT